MDSENIGAVLLNYSLEEHVQNLDKGRLKKGESKNVNCFVMDLKQSKNCAKSGFSCQLFQVTSATFLLRCNTIL